MTSDTHPYALAGFKVLELCRVPPAELPGMMLADAGADVLKIDTPAELNEDARRRAVYSHSNRNKRSMALNLKSEEGVGVFMRLAEKADVIIEGFRPGVTDRLGIGYATVSERNPGLVYCSMSGFGQMGPNRNRAAHDLNFLALSGALTLWGEPGRAPDIPSNLVADLAGAAMHAATAISFALLARYRTGKGQFLDISYLDSTIAVLAASANLSQWPTLGSAAQSPAGVLSGQYPFYALYEAEDGGWLSVACSEPALWKNFCVAIGLPDLGRHARRPEHYVRAPNCEEAAAHKQVAARIKQSPVADWERVFAQYDVAVAPVLTFSEAMASDHVAYRGLRQEATHPIFGTVPQVGSALGMRGTPPLCARAAPWPGQDSEAVAVELGFDRAEINRLKAKGVLT